MQALDQRIADMGQEILLRTKARQDCDDLGREIVKLWEKKYQLQLEDAEKESTRQKIAELKKTLSEIGGKATEYEDSLVQKLIERITVHDDHFTVEFKAGIEAEVQM